MGIYVVPTSGPVYSIRNPESPVETHQIIKQIGLEFLQVMYSESGPDTRLAWKPEIDESDIAIVDKYSFNLDDVNVRPAIVANRGPTRWMSSSGFQQMQEMDMRTAAVTSSDLISGSIVFNCFSREGVEAEAIAGDVFDWFRVFRKPLRKNGFFRVQSTSMGEEALVKSDSRPDLSVVPVQIEASIQVRWTMKPYANELKSLVASLGKITTPYGSFNL